MASSCCSTSPTVEDTCTSNATCGEATVPVAKFHTSLNVSNLDRSVAFYTLLLGGGPVKERSDYAKFELDEPPLVLSLIPGRPGAGGPLNHFGLRVVDTETLVETQRRLELGGIRTTREEGVECCYARQTKFWVADPDQVMWEIYVFHDDIEDHGDGEVPKAEELQQASAPAATKVTWRHQIHEPIPDRIDHADCSVHEVFLEGTANLAAAVGQLPGLLKEAFRVLRPGGEIRLHGLSADKELKEALPGLPGPAAAVQCVPTHTELVEALRTAGFGQVHLEKLSSTAHFTVAEVGLREIMLVALKPGHRTANTAKTAVYLGPFAQVSDDFGNVYQRGVPTALNMHDWQALANGRQTEAFLLF
ncbi:MAG: ArsI/CadI family heavy metal resistance metalloenzyme [Verrucomicrobium sp.]